MLKKISDSRKPIIYSEDEPIEVNFIYPETLKPKTGSVGITIAPGANHEHGDVIWQRDLKTDLARLKKEFRVNVLVSLVEDFELQNLRNSELPEIAEQFGIKLLRFPLVDASVPNDFESLKFIAQKIEQEFEEGNVVVIHCLAGLGRSGMVAACWLVTKGLSAQKAIRHVQTYRKGSLFLKIQQSYVREFSKTLRTT